MITSLKLKECKTSPKWIKRFNPWKQQDLTLSLPYAGRKGQLLIRKWSKTVSQSLNSTNSKMQVIYNTRKLSTNLPVTFKTNPQHQHNIVYHAEYPKPNCNYNYTGQTKCRLLKHVIQHNKTDKNSHLLKHSLTKNHHRVWFADFKDWGQVTNLTLKERSVKLFLSKKRNLTSMFKKKPTHWSYTIDVTTSQCYYTIAFKILCLSSWWCSMDVGRNIEFE